MKNPLPLIAVLAGLTGCQATFDLSGLPEDEPAQQGVHLVQQSTLWVQTAGEYRASALQAWRAARTTLDLALADPNWTAAVEQSGNYQSLPPALIVDADETVIDNSPFEAQLVVNDTVFEQPMWEDWVAMSAAREVPGATAFLREAAARGVTVFYVTNRDHGGEAATMANFRALGFPVAEGEDVLLTRGENGWTSDKGPRRAHVAARYRVVLMAGDDMNDFVAGTRVDPRTRLEIVDRYRDYWGERWIVLPNPLYGSWDRALYDFDGSLSEDEKNRRRREALILP